MRPSGRQWIQIGGAISITAGGVFALLTELAKESTAKMPIWVTWTLLPLFVIAGVALTVLTVWTERSAKQTAEDSKQAFSSAVEQTVAALEKTLPTPEKPLEDEIAEVSGSLSRTVARLRQISDKAQAFEADVKDLVARADAARATAKLHEEDARKIALLLGSETEQRIRSEINTLKVEHERQINLLRRSGNRMALWTFVGGVVLGMIGNIVVAILIT